MVATRPWHITRAAGAAGAAGAAAGAATERLDRAIVATAITGAELRFMIASKVERLYVQSEAGGPPEVRSDLACASSCHLRAVSHLSAMVALTIVSVRFGPLPASRASLDFSAAVTVRCHRVLTATQ